MEAKQNVFWADFQTGDQSSSHTCTKNVYTYPLLPALLDVRVCSTCLSKQWLSARPHVYPSFSGELNAGPRTLPNRFLVTVTVIIWTIEEEPYDGAWPIDV